MAEQKESSERLVRIYKTTISNDTFFSSSSLKEHTSDNKKYETANMFQGIEEVDGVRYNRRVYKTQLNTPLFIDEEGVQVVKIYSTNMEENEAKEMLRDTVEKRLKETQKMYQEHIINLKNAIIACS